ncbi:MAG: NUDIX domain-containing protein [Clostridia bacterium]|nr:NUDIX domain-containing protein [Clostridia bacterium]
MEDLTIDLKEGRLNCRAAGIIIHDGKVLFHKNTNDSYYALIGGRVKICESSADTIVRELKEEIGKDVEIIGYIATIENFFELKEKKYHEIMFVHLVEFCEENDKKITEILHNIEGGKDKDVYYEWLQIDEIDNYDIRPGIIKDILKKGIFPVHLINKE